MQPSPRPHWVGGIAMQPRPHIHWVWGNCKGKHALCLCFCIYLFNKSNRHAMQCKQSNSWRPVALQCQQCNTMCLLLWVGGDAKQRFLDAVYWGNEQSLGTLGCSLPKVGGLLLCRRCNAMKPNNAIALRYTQPNAHFPLPLPQQLQCNKTLCIA